MEPTPWLLSRDYFRRRLWERDGVLRSEWAGHKFLVYISTSVACYLPLRWILTGQQDWEMIHSSLTANQCSLCQADHRCRRETIASVHSQGNTSSEQTVEEVRALQTPPCFWSHISSLAALLFTDARNQWLQIVMANCIFPCSKMKIQPQPTKWCRVGCVDVRKASKEHFHLETRCSKLQRPV